jgi:hypothetical protein
MLLYGLEDLQDVFIVFNFEVIFVERNTTEHLLD